MICEYLLSFMITSSGECIDFSHLVGGGVAHKERRIAFPEWLKDGSYTQTEIETEPYRTGSYGDSAIYLDRYVKTIKSYPNAVTPTTSVETNIFDCRSGFARSWVIPFVGDAVLTNWQRWEHPSIAGVCGGAGL